ncbi:hypothetical protein [Erwinia persicina]|uniref:hypothetical protein n=1 Tax=Erwinia persicina TaxID=55211 RepID=UPI003B972A4C
MAEKQRRFSRALASDISWLLKEGRGKGVRAGSGSLKAQNDLYRLQHALNAVKMTGESSATRFPPASAGTSPGWTCC